MSKVGVGIIGLGMAIKPHMLSLRDLSHRVDVVAGFSPTPQRRDGVRDGMETHAAPGRSTRCSTTRASRRC